MNQDKKIFPNIPRSFFLSPGFRRIRYSTFDNLFSKEPQKEKFPTYLLACCNQNKFDYLFLLPLQRILRDIFLSKHITPAVHNPSASLNYDECFSILDNGRIIRLVCSIIPPHNSLYIREHQQREKNDKAMTNFQVFFMPFGLKSSRERKVRLTLFCSKVSNLSAIWRV